MSNLNVLELISSYDAEGNLCFSCYVVGDPAAPAPEALPDREVIDFTLLAEGRDYGDFGRLADAEDQRYQAREWEALTFQYNRATSYDPTPGRMQTGDPIAFQPGDGNLFRFVPGDKGAS
jgi:hypothetical protein